MTPGQPTTLSGAPLYFSPFHATYFERLHNLPPDSVEAAYRHHFAAPAANVLAELLTYKSRLETYENGEVIYPPEKNEIDFKPRRQPLTGAQRLARVEHAIHMPKRMGAVKEKTATSSTVSVADGHEGGSEGRSIVGSTVGVTGPVRRSEYSYWERPMGTGNRVSKASKTSPTTPRATYSRYWREV